MGEAVDDAVGEMLGCSTSGSLGDSVGISLGELVGGSTGGSLGGILGFSLGPQHIGPAAEVAKLQSPGSISPNTPA